MKRKWKVVVSLFIVLLMLAGCTGNKQNGKSNEDNGKKDELVLAFNNEPEDGFDPITGWGRYGSPLFQSTLLKRDDELKIVNDLATGYEVSEDEITWTVSLREDVKFSDGEPLTAEDVVFTFEQAANSGSVVDLNSLEKVEAEDAYTVIFTLTEPQSTFVNNLVATGIVPKHAYRDDYAENPIGSGPFKMVQWDKGQQLIVEANAHYYEKQPYFKQLTFLFLNEDAAFAAAQAGTVDFTYIPAAFSKQDVPGMKLEVVETVDNRGIVFPMVPAGEETEDGRPIGNDVTSDVAIRKAIDVAVDRQALIDGVLEGYGTPAYTSVDKLPWWNEASVIEDGDVEKAKRLLADSGWTDTDGDGIVEKDGVKAAFELYYLANDDIRQSLSIAIADALKPLGIQVHVEGGSWDVIRQKMHSQAVLMGWGSHDPHELYNIYGSDNAGVEYFNTGFYKNEKVDDYFELALHAKTEAEAIEYWQKAQWDGETGLNGKGDAPWVWLVNMNHLYLVKDQLDIGTQRIHVHGHAWPATDNIVDWKWTTSGE